MLKLFAPKKKKKSTLEMVTQRKIDKDIPPTIPVAAPPPPPIEPSPVLLMPKPKYAVPPTKEVLSQFYENDKTELELSEEEKETTEDVSPIMLPHRVRFMSSSSSSHGTSPPPLLNKAPTGSPTVINKRTSIATSSEDSHRVYESALQSPVSSPPQVAQQQQQQQQLPNNNSCTSLDDVEALQRQVQYIQHLCEKERQEWMKREHAHRLREKEMLEKISETQDQLRQALEQVQQQQEQQQHFHPHPSCDDSGYIEYEDDEPGDIDDGIEYHYQHRHYSQLPRARSMERPGSRQHGSRRWLRRRSVSVEKPRVIPDEYRMPRRSRSRASSYYDEEDERDAYFLVDDAVDDGFEDDVEEVEDWDYYQPGTVSNSRAAPRPRVSESTPTVRYLRPRRSYRRPSVQYYPAYYHHYYPYDL